MLTERTAPGLHEEVFRYLTETFPSTIRLLDMAAGTGAWLERLRRAGFVDLSGADIDSTSYEGPTRFVRANLNEHFVPLVQRQLGEERFDVITSIETIEHLENPSDFLRQCKDLLKPNGTLLITSPNVESMPGRLKFLIKGRLRMFEENGDLTHITPITSFLFERVAGRNGFVIQSKIALLRAWPSSRRLVRGICTCLSPLLNGETYGDCHLFILHPIHGNGSGD